MSGPASLEFSKDEWVSMALTVIEDLDPGASLTADLLREDLPPAPHDNLWGALFMTANAKGLIARAGYTTSRTKSRRHGSVRVWTRK